MIISQESVLRNIDCEIDKLYLVINPGKNDIDFEVLYPIIPDYFWNCPDGRKLRSEIDKRLLDCFRQYLEEEPNYRSYKEAGLNKDLYTKEKNINQFGPIQRYSKDMSAPLEDSNEKA